MWDIGVLVVAVVTCQDDPQDEGTERSDDLTVCNLGSSKNLPLSD